MATIDPHEPCPVYVVRNESEGVYEFQVRPNGVTVVFATRKLGGIDSDLIRAEQSAPPSPPSQAPTPQNEPPAPPTPSV